MAQHGVIKPAQPVAAAAGGEDGAGVGAHRGADRGDLASVTDLGGIEFET